VCFDWPFTTSNIDGKEIDRTTQQPGKRSVLVGLSEKMMKQESKLSSWFQMYAVLCLLLGIIGSSVAFSATSTGPSASRSTSLFQSPTTRLAAVVSDPAAVNGDAPASEPLESKVEPPPVATENSKTTVPNEKDDDDDRIPIFDNLAARAAVCLFESELRRDAKGEHTKLVSSSATNWINDATAFALQKTFDRVKLKVRCLPLTKN
jgi:hypothetical protein